MERTEGSDVDVLTTIVGALKKMDKGDQQRTLFAVATFLGIDLSPLVQRHSSSAAGTAHSSQNNSPVGPGSFSEDRTLSPKDFLRDKQPLTDVERVACLAYYLTHYRGTGHFKTLDISALNTEAAQQKFSNASNAVDNATRAGYLVQALKGNKQITAAGESLVQHLPDREAARASALALRPKRQKKV